MRSKILTVTLLATILLSSCFGGDNDKKDANKPTENRVDQTPEAREAQYKEESRVATLSKLTDDNLATQVEEKDGKKILKDRRLFVNYFKAQNVNSSEKLIDALGKVESFAKSNGVELNESDIMVMIAGSQIENPTWNVCGDFNANKSKLDSGNKFYGYIAKMCNPPTPPGPRKTK